MNKNARLHTKYNFASGFAHIIVLVLIVLVGVGGIGYWMYKNGQIKVTPSQNQQQNTLTTTPAPQIPSDWKTYRNEEYGFEFKYPSNLYYEDNPEFPGGNSISFFSTGTKASYGFGDAKGNEIFVFDTNSDSRTIAQLRKDYFPNSVEMTVGSKPAIKNYPDRPSYTIKPTNDTRISLGFGEQLTEIQIDHILSTFQFTD